MDKLEIIEDKLKLFRPIRKPQITIIFDDEYIKLFNSSLDKDINELCLLITSKSFTYSSSQFWTFISYYKEWKSVYCSTAIPNLINKGGIIGSIIIGIISLMMNLNIISLSCALMIVINGSCLLQRKPRNNFCYYKMMYLLTDLIEITSYSN
jgi:hypothetical protein